MKEFIELMTTEVGSTQIWEVPVMIVGIILTLCAIYVFINTLFNDVFAKYVGKEKARKQKRITLTSVYTLFVLVAVVTVIF